MTTNEKLWQLVKRLHQKTIEGTVPWEVSFKATYLAAFPKYGVRVSEIVKEDSLDYVIELLDENGRVIESASDADLRDVAAPGESYPVMKELFVMARRRALGVDEALDDLLSSLDESS